MSKSANNRRKESQLWLRLPVLVREALYDKVIGVGLACGRRRDKAIYLATAVLVLLIEKYPGA